MTDRTIDNMRMQNDIVAKRDVFADNRIRPDPDVLSNEGFRMDNGGGMNRLGHVTVIESP